MLAPLFPRSLITKDTNSASFVQFSIIHFRPLLFYPASTITLMELALHRENDLVASTKPFVNLASPNHDYCGDSSFVTSTTITVVVYT